MKRFYAILQAIDLIKIGKEVTWLWQRKQHVQQKQPRGKNVKIQRRENRYTAQRTRKNNNKSYLIIPDRNEERYLDRRILINKFL